MKADYLIVGSGLFGATFARLAAEADKTCIIVDKRHHAGGNVYSEKLYGIHIHTYGPHIFHTSNKEIWDFANRFAEFIPYVYSPKALTDSGHIYSLPFNMNTFNEMFGIRHSMSPQYAKEFMSREVDRNEGPKNLEEYALSQVGYRIYTNLIQHYTKKQWMRDPKDLPADIIKRIPVRYTYDNNYFNDIYQGIPKDGYANFISNLLDHDNIEVHLATKYTKGCELEQLAETVVYTGPIDEYYDYCFGELEYRTLKFETEVYDTDNYQGVAVINDCTSTNPWTRTIEHRHFDRFCTSKVTVVTKETPVPWTKDSIPYYPINDSKNQAIYKKYEAQAKEEKNVIFGGRLAEYRYYDMHQVIGSAMAKWRKENAGL